MSKRSKSSFTLARPTMVDGFYPERPLPPTGLLSTLIHKSKVRTLLSSNRAVSTSQMLQAVHDHSEELQHCTDAKLRELAVQIRQQLHRQGITAPLVYQTFGLIREFSDRILGMCHYDSQLIGGLVLIQGKLAEMETGEGKTLTATLAAATAAMAGIPTHVVTVNDYLVNRDKQMLEPLYRALGVTVGAVTEEMDNGQRRQAYQADITYCTNKQLAFDYLRDRLVIGGDQGRLKLQVEGLHDKGARSDNLFLRGLCFAIVDEADSVFIDEARTPLVISRTIDAKDEEQTYHQAIELAQLMVDGTDFKILEKTRTVELLEAGKNKADKAASALGGVWTGSRRREELIKQGLAALHLFQRDRHYLLREGKVLIIDENTGRIMADRSWERGLHQMVEIKEGCEVTGQRDNLARLTYQRFFRRYMHLSGMTGTATEVKQELWNVYGLDVVKVPTHVPSQRTGKGYTLFPTLAAKEQAITAQVAELIRLKRPVLIGTRSVAASEQLSRLLSLQGIPHQVLNAQQDKNEAQVVARAGASGVVTIATNMAGRGTDIPLGRGVAEQGGLHIIVTELNDARRIDRQLYGRCGRQGDPGSYELFLSFEDELFATRPHWFARLARMILNKKLPFAGQMGFAALRLAQRATERHHFLLRRKLLAMDEQVSRLLAFSGRLE